MDDAMDCLIDLNSPVPSNPRTSLVPPISMCQKTTPAFPCFVEPCLPEDNNPFDLVSRQTEMNEANKNDPFEMAFETACGYQVENSDLSVITMDSENHIKAAPAKPADVAEKSTKVPVESQELKECIDKVSTAFDEVNLDDVQPPEGLINSSLDLSDNDSITINDTLHLSSMSDLKLTGEELKSSPVMEEHCSTDNFFLGESAMSSKRKSTVKCENTKRALSPINFPTESSALSQKSSSFEESPSKALCELKSEESVKTLIETRIQKCIAKALNDSHQLRNSFLLDIGETSFVANQVKPPKGNLRASLSVPQNLHLLHHDTTCLKPEQSTDIYSLSPVKQKLLEELTIPVLDQKLGATTMSFNMSFDITNNKPEILAAQTTEIQPTSSIPEEKLSQYREIIHAELQHAAHTSLEVKTESKAKGHRRSLSCDVVLPPQLLTKGSSPPKLPPLPLTSDTIRDLSLCSKYSPPKSKKLNRSPGNLPPKIPNRPVPVSLPACPQPKLVLKKKSSTAKSGPITATGSFAGAIRGPIRGPMKAIVPVKNMTRLTGSPRPSVQPLSRRVSTALSRQSALDSPNIQKSKLCPLAASTPSQPAVLDKAGVTRAPPVITAASPRRSTSRGIPSPYRRSSNTTANTSQTSNAKADTPTRRASVSTHPRNANPRILLDKNNGYTLPTTTPVRKAEAQTAAHTQLGRVHSQTLGKENMACQ